MATKGKSIRDNFSNKFYGTVTESAANTLTFAEISTNVNIFTKIAWILNRLEWYLPYATWSQITDNGDLIDMALTASDQISAIGLDNASVIDKCVLGVKYFGAAATASLMNMPIPRDFSNLPGGGLIIAPRPLFVAAKATGFATASQVEIRGYFQQIDMTPEEYLDLIDFYRIVS